MRWLWPVSGATIIEHYGGGVSAVAGGQLTQALVEERHSKWPWYFHRERRHSRRADQAIRAAKMKIVLANTTGDYYAGA